MVLLTAACHRAPKGALKTDGALSDSTTLRIEKIAETDTAQAFRMLDSLYDEGKLAAHTYYYTRARVYQGTVDRLLTMCAAPTRHPTCSSTTASAPRCCSG